MVLWNGSAWSLMTTVSGTAESWTGVWGASWRDVYVADYLTGLMLRFDGLSWVPLTSSAALGLSWGLTGSRADDVVTVGTHAMSRHWGGLIPHGGVYLEAFERGVGPDFTLAGTFQQGAPAGAGGPGRCDEGSSCFGVNLGGRYAHNLAWGSTHAESPPSICRSCPARRMAPSWGCTSLPGSSRS